MTPQHHHDRHSGAPTARRGVRWSMILVGVLIASTGLAVIGDLHPEAANAARPDPSRVASSGRYSTAVAVSQTSFPDGADVVWVASGESFPDALSAAPASVAQDGPLLLTKSGELPSVVAQEIDRVDPDRIVIVGGEASVSAAVEASLTTSGATVERIGGVNRFETSRLIADYAFDSTARAYVATGTAYPDALSASAAAGAQGAPVVLVRGSATAADQATMDLLDSLSVSTVYVAGGTASVSSGLATSIKNSGKVITRLAGSGRYSTSVAVSKSAFASADTVYVASGTNFPDGLVGASLAARSGSPLYLSTTDCIPDVVAADIENRLAAADMVLVGGRSVLGSNVANFVDCTAWTAQRKATSEKALLDKLNARLATLGGWYSVSVRKLNGLKERVTVNGTRQKEPASSIKIFAAYAALDRIDAGTLSMSTRLPSGVTIQNCMRAMIHVSDNYCHTDLIRYLGAGTMNAKFAAEGYSGTHYTAGSYTSKTSSALDLSVLLARLEAGTLLSASSTKHLTSLLSSQVWRTRIASGLPVGVKAATKPGELWRTTGMIQTDAGIVYGRSGTYTIAIMGDNNATKAEIGAISRVVYTHFNGSFGAGQTYPRQQLSTKFAVALRSSPGGSVIATIPAGALAEVDVSSRIWYRVAVNGRSGYIDMVALANRY